MDRSVDHIDKTIGKRIAEVRKMRKLTQEEFANKLELSSQQIQKYEYGETKISITRLFEIAVALDVGVWTFIEPVAQDFYESIGQKEVYILRNPEEVKAYEQFDLLTDEEKEAFRTIVRGMVERQK